MQNKEYIKNKKAFSIIELLIGIFIFSMGLVSVYSLIVSILNLNDYNENYIIAAYLANEQIELVRNVRDTNYERVQKYNQMNPWDTSYDQVILTGSYYRIQNHFGLAGESSVAFDEISSFGEGQSEISGAMKYYRVCQNEDGLYLYCQDESGNDLGGLKKTHFYKFLFIDELTMPNNNGDLQVVDKALKVTSKVIWNFKGYHEYQIKSVLTDWKVL